MYGYSFTYNIAQPEAVLVIESEGNAPTDISLSVASIDEFEAVGSIVGDFSTTDADVGDTFTYSLVAGTGDTDNSSFTIDAANLKTAEVFDVLFPTEKSSYAIRVRSTDAGGLSTEKAFTITINQIQPAENETSLLDENLPFENIGYRLVHLNSLGISNTLIDIAGNQKSGEYSYPQTTEVLEAVDSLKSRGNIITGD